ncbi:CBS domain-containing protein [Streptomyces sp. NPDC054794]
MADLCSEELIAVSPDEDLDHAVESMRGHCVRRLPVVEGDEWLASSRSAISAWPRPTRNSGTR